MAAERRARVVEVVEHGPATRALRLALPSNEPLRYRSGQFVSILVPDGDRVMHRPYSLSSEPGDPRLELLADRVPGGPGSRYLFALGVGDDVRLTGPWGTFGLGDAPLDGETIFVAEGTGIAPIRPMLHEATRRTPRPALRLLYGTRLGVYRDELERLPGLDVTVVPPDRVYDEAVHRWIDGDGNRSRRFFVCGVGAPVLALRDRLRAAGYARRAVQYERW